MSTLTHPSRRRTGPPHGWARPLGAALTLMVIVAMACTARAALPSAIAPSPATGSTGVGSRATLAWSDGQLDLIQNGGFEQGLTGWSVQTQGFNASVVVNTGTQNPQGADGPTPPLEGSSSAFLQQGFFGDSQIVLFQEVTIPTNSSRATLRWSHRIRSYGDFILTANDFHGFIVQIVDVASGQGLLVPFLTEPGDTLLQDWSKRSVDLSPYAGRRLLIGFISIITNGDLTVHLDRISLIVDSPAGVTSGVLMSTNAIVTVSDQIGATMGKEWLLENLRPNTTYNWRILSSLGGEQVLSPVWSFTTASPGGLHQFQWSPLPDTVTAGAPLPVTLTARDALGFQVTGFTDTVNLAAAILDLSGPAQRLLPDDPYTSLADYENTTLGYAFTPNTGLWITHFRTYGGDSASLWTDEGVLLARSPLSAPGGTWTDTPLPRPLFLRAGQRYRLSFFSGALQSQFMRFDAPTAFAHGTLHQSYLTQGNGFPTTPHPAQWFFVDLAYHPGPGAAGLAVTPSVSAPFVQGAWSGTLTLPNIDASSVALLADTGAGSATSFSAPFALASILDNDGDGLPDDWEDANGLDSGDPDDADLDFDTDGAINRDEYLAGTDPNNADSVLALDAIEIDGDDVVLRFQTITGGTYRLDKATRLDMPDWSPLGGLISGDDTQREVRDLGAAATGPAFYRLYVTRP